MKTQILGHKSLSPQKELDLRTQRLRAQRLAPWKPTRTQRPPKVTNLPRLPRQCARTPPHVALLSQRRVWKVSHASDVLDEDASPDVLDQMSRDLSLLITLGISDVVITL